MSGQSRSKVVDLVHGRWVTGLARDREEVRESQALRYRVFALEMGATLHSPSPGLDHDAFDPYCRHLVVRDRMTQRVVACTRILEGWQATRAGGFYSAGEFRLDPLLSLPGRKLEIGRTCVDANYRGGAVLAMLWSGLAAFVHRHRYDYLLGCASVAAHDNGVAVRSLMAQMRDRHMTSDMLRVVPHQPVPGDGPLPLEPAPTPPLLRAYLALGAKICGEPCLDPDFQVADLLLLLDIRELSMPYARHFLPFAERRRGIAA